MSSVSQDEAVSAEPALCRPILKLKLERQLDRAGAADLVQRREAAVLSPAAEEVVQRLCGFAELWRSQIVIRGAEVRMIENIEEIAPDLKREMFGKAKLPA